MNTRFAGLLYMIGSGLLVLDMIRLVSLGLESFDTTNLLVGILWAIGGIGGLLGMIALQAVGKTLLLRGLACIPIFGFGLLIVGNLMQLAGLVTTETNMAAGIGWLVLLMGMVLVGILTIAAKRWRGWQRFVPYSLLLWRLLVLLSAQSLVMMISP
jgi:hypothetical protein